MVIATNVKMLLNNPPTPFDKVHRCRRMRLGLSLESSEVVAFEDRYHTRLSCGYGGTETLGSFVADVSSSPRRIGSLGRVRPGYEVSIVDEDGRELSAGESGEIVVRATNPHDLTHGYYNNPEATAAAYIDGGYRCGDIGYFDTDGFMWFVERKVDVIKRSGYSISANEIERTICELDGVVEACVVGTPDAIRQEAVVAYVVRSSATITPATITEHCSGRLAGYKVPEVVEFIPDLPRNFVGKLDRKALRDDALRFRVGSQRKKSSRA